MSRSKFSVLRIEDDSEEEFVSVGSIAKGGSRGRGGGFVNQGRGGKNVTKGREGGSSNKTTLIVHAVETQRPKKKKNNKDRVIDPITGLTIQEDGVNAEDLAKKEHMRQALAAALATTPTESAFKNANGLNEPVDQLESEVQQNTTVVSQPTYDVDAEIQKLNLSTNDHSELAQFYRSRLNEALAKLDAANEQIATANSQADYYKNRYRRLVELFKDTEFSERAKLVMELERQNAVVQDLSMQLSQAKWHPEVLESLTDEE